MNEAEIKVQVPFSNAVCLCGKKLAEHSMDELRACAVKFGGTVTGDEIDMPGADFAPPEGREKG